MSLATVVANAAKRAVKSWGAPGTLTHATPGSYDTNTGGVSVSTSTTSVRAVLDGAVNKFNPELVRSGDMRALLAGVTPAEGDVLTLAAGTFTVIEVRPTYVQATQVMAECLVRR